MKKYLIVSAIFLFAFSPAFAHAQTASIPFAHYGFFYDGYTASNNDLADLKTYTNTGFAKSPDQVSLLTSKGFQDIVYEAFFDNVLSTILSNESIAMPAGGAATYDYRTISNYETKAIAAYQQYLNALKSSLSTAGALDNIGTFYIADEPALKKNFIPNQAFLNNIESTFKSVFPGKKSVMVFAEDTSGASSLRGAHFTPPPTLDIVTVDPYFWNNTTVACSSADIQNYLYNTNPNSTVSWAEQFGKPVWVAGDAMLRGSTDPLPCYITTTFNLLKNDSKVQGLVWIMYDGVFTEGLVGAKNSPALISEIKALTPSVSIQPPVLASLSPTSGSAGTVVTVTGSNFGTTNSVILTGDTLTATTVNVPSKSNSQLAYTVPSATQVPAGPYKLSIKDGATGLASANSFPFTVIAPSVIPPVNTPPPAPAPAQNSVLTPNQVQTILQFLGTFSVDQSVIDNVRIALSAGAPNSQSASTGTGTASAGNTTPTGAQPIITLIYPSIVTEGQSTDIIGYGSNLSSGMQIVYTGSHSGSLQPILISQSQYKFNTGQFSPGYYSFYVKNPGGKSSGSLAFTITAPASGGGIAVNPSYTPPPVCSPTTTTPPPSDPGAPPATCFGRNVKYYQKVGNLFMQNGVDVTRSGLLSIDSNDVNSIEVVRFKTDAAGYMTSLDIGFNDNFQILNFISPTPCDYEWAYNNSPSLNYSGRLGSFVYGGPALPLITGWPVLADNQVAPYFAVKPAAYDRRGYLKPNTYYYYHVLNANILRGGDLTSPVVIPPTITTNAQLATAIDTCNEQRDAVGLGEGSCQPFRFDQSVFVRSEPYVNPEGFHIEGNLISGLPTPTTTTGQTCTPPPSGTIPPGPSCSGAIITPATGPSSSSLQWILTNIVFGGTSAFPTCNAEVTIGRACSQPGVSCSQLPSNSINLNEYTCKSGTVTPVNGTCGASACSSVSSAPTAGFCSTGTASAVSGTGPYTWSCTGSNGGSSVSCSAGKSGTTPTPVVASCAAGEVFGGGDADWNPLTNTKMFPSQPIAASGDRGTAVKFVANNTLYPNGVMMEVFDQSGSALLKDAVISACPHNFTPVGGQATCAKSGIANQGDFGLRFGPAQMYYDCALTPGNTYYLNFRATDVPRDGIVATQFTNFVR